MNALILQNRRTGEQFELQRVAGDGRTWLTLRGTLPTHRQGPLLHVHYKEAEEFHVLAGTLSAVVDGRQIQVDAGGTANFPAGAVHRWWNDGDETLVLEGFVKPAVDFDRYLQATFEVLNGGISTRPPLFYMAHLAWRHRRTQAGFFMPRPLQAVMLPLIVLIGTMLGRYRGTNRPGSPSRCMGAPLITGEGV